MDDLIKHAKKDYYTSSVLILFVLVLTFLLIIFIEEFKWYVMLLIVLIQGPAFTLSRRTLKECGEI